jgi:hypothetical protein
MDTTRFFGKAISDMKPMFEETVSGIKLVPLSRFDPEEYTLHKYERSLTQSFFEK